MNEIELRFQVPEGQEAAVQRWVGGSGRQRASTERLQAEYFDTIDRQLAHAGFALRLRKEGDVWVQTLKGAAPDGMSRLEHNVPLGAESPTLDVQRHADHPAGQALLELLATLEPDALQPLFRTDIQRLKRPLKTPHGSVELAFDQGALLAGEGDDERRTRVCELEIELKSGEARAVLEVARHWAIERFGLTLELRTKALRGDLLARRLDCAPVAPSRALHWPAEVNQDDALHLLLRECLDPVLGNASQILSGVHEPEHLHQLRAALRRLRVGVRLIADAGDPALQALADGAGQLSRALTAARDADAQAQAPWRRALDRAWRTERPSAAESEAPAPVDAAAPLRTREVQEFLLAVIGWLAAAPLEEAPDLSSAHERLQGWLAAALKQVKRFDKLDVAGRHHLRRRLRRVRLGMELLLDVPGGADGRRLSRKERAAREDRLALVHAAQQALGALNDLEVGLTQARETLAMAMARADVTSAARAGFALGTLRPRQTRALKKAAKAVKALRRG